MRDTKGTFHASSAQFSHSVVSDSLRPHGLQHARLSCPSPTPGAYLNSCPLSRWCHPTISSSVVPFSSCLQSFPASGSIKDRNGMDLTEAEDIKRRWQEYTEELYKKIFMTQITTMMLSPTYSHTSWNVKWSGSYEGSLQTMLVEVIEFQQLYFKS